MDYSVRYIDESQIIEVKFSGRTSYKSAEQYSKDALKAAHEHGCRRFLIDHTTTVSPVNIHLTGEELQQFGFMPDDRVAIVGANLKSAVSASQNSRWSRSGYFENVEDAVNWLIAV